MTAVLLALLTAAVYGVANYLGPLLGRRHALGGVLLVGQAVGALGAVVLLAAEPAGAPDARHLLLGIGAGACNGVALASLYRASGAGPISIVAPIGSTGAVVPVAVAILGGERPELLQLLGIPLAMVGVVLAAARDGASDQQVRRSTVLLALLAALTFGGFLTLFGRASDAGVPWAVLSSRVALVVCTGIVLAVARVPVRLPARAAAASAVPGLLLLCGTVAYATATTRGLLSVVSVIATLSPVVTVGLAVVLLGERLAARQRLGVVTALVGVVLLAAG